MLGATLLLVFIQVLIAVAQNKNNACLKWADYNRIDGNAECSYNQDQDLNVVDIIAGHGYPVETHKVMTKDGYILTLFRIVSNGPSVIVTHGIALCSACMVNVGNRSLGLTLYKAGYDVWLLNLRGTIYSKTHRNLNSTSREYWKFSWQEMATYDLPAAIELVVAITQHKIQAYIGYSMGNTCALAYASENPDHAEKHIKSIIAIAPIAYMANVESPITKLAPLWSYVEPWVNFLFNGRIIEYSDRLAQTRLNLCMMSTATLLLCVIIPELILFGFNFEELDPFASPTTIKQNLDTISINTLSHYAYNINQKDFRKFDYGTWKNYIMYNSATPPRYNVSKIPVPVCSVYSDNDYFSAVKDVEYLYGNLQGAAKTCGKKLLHKFSHNDMITAKHADTEIYNHVVDYLTIIK